MTKPSQKITGSIQKCPRCGGSIIDEGPESHCLQCGYVDYHRLAERDLVEPAVLPAAEAPSELAGQAGAPENSANEQPADPDPGNLATQSNAKTTERCRSCKFLEEHDGRYYCGSRTCPGRLPIATRPPYWKRWRESANKVPDPEPEPDPWGTLTATEKTEICRYARQFGVKAAGVKYDVPWRQIRSSIGGKLSYRNKLFVAAESPPPPAGDPQALPPLPGWREDWPAEVKLAWLLSRLAELEKQNGKGGKH